ncbi:MAG: right-handed parallel beta-helix repeat-containing protein, partial [Solirubrobacterales bacterium]
MGDNDRRAKLGFFALVLLLAARVCGDEATWIAGASSPAAWSISPTDPNDGEMIYFSGPTRVYVSASVAERALGGKPTLDVDVNAWKVRLLFKPPASADDATLNPVCGLEGSFGQLAAGQWTFVCSQSGIEFSIPFTVTSDPTLNVSYVDRRATGAHDGTSWTNAFTNLQNALAAVKGKGDCEIRVAEGVYQPDAGASSSSDPVTATFRLMEDVTIKGGYAGVGSSNPNQRDILDHETILSGDLAGNDSPSATRHRLTDDSSRADNCYHVVTAAGVDSTAVLDGFTIQGGYAYGASSPEKTTYGGGLYIDEASPVIRNCLIERNAAAYYGGGVYCRGVCSPVFVDCVIADNWAYWRGGGMYRDWGSTIAMERCLISGNAAVYDGGGIANHTEGELTLSNCVLSGNLTTGVDSGRGGAIYCFLASAYLEYCTFVGNSSTYGAGLACASSGQPGSSSIGLRHCILWDKGDSLWTNDGSAMDVSYCDVQGGWLGVGNLDVDPDFVDPGHWDDKGTPGNPADDVWYDGDYRLSWVSPCVDAGDPRETPDASATDFAGRPRLSGAAVDMGAYELTNEPPVAEAGPDVAGFSLDGAQGEVTLDGSGSLDPEGQTLTYRWYRDGKLVSTQATFTTTLPVGEHTFTLIVNDGLSDSDPDRAKASIWTVIPTTATITPKTIVRGKANQTIVAMIILPTGRSAADFDKDEP